jgi:hypothetical protein
MNTKESYALGYYYGRAEGSYGLIDLDKFSDQERHEFRLGYDAGVADYCNLDTDQDDEPTQQTITEKLKEFFESQDPAKLMEALRCS